MHCKYICGGGVQPLTANAETYGDLTYITVDEDDDGTYDYVGITDCNELVTAEVEIPAEIDGLPVTRIYYNAFCGCSTLESVIIPDSVTYLDDYSFYRCVSLKSVVIPDNVDTIGYYAFGDCTSLESINLPDNDTHIGFEAFIGCTNLKNVTIPDSITDINNGAFSGTPWLEEKRNENPLVIVNSVLIDGITSSGDVVIPTGVTNIGVLAFYNQYENLTADNVKSVIIPDSVTNISSGAFVGCSNLKSITIYNPECKIYDSEETIINTATIYGYSNSTAQAYAEKYGCKFESIGEYTPEFILGDANGDGKLRASDAAFIAKTLAEASINGKKVTVDDYPAADFNGDGKVTAADAAAIAKYLAEQSLKN